MFNLDARTEYNNNLNKDVLSQIPYKPLRRQASVTQQIHHDIFFPTSTVVKQTHPTTNQEQIITHQRSQSKLNYPHQTTDIFNLTPSKIQKRQQGKGHQSHIQTQMKHNISPRHNRHKPKDHPVEFILHCASPQKSVQPSQPTQDFLPKYKEETIFQRRQRDFVQNEITSNQIIPTKTIKQESPNTVAVCRDQSNRLVNPKKSDYTSNIFAIPEKDIKNQTHIFSKQDQKSDLNQTYGKSINHPWLQTHTHKASQFSEQIGSDQNYSQEKRLQMLKSTIDNNHQIPRIYPLIDRELNKKLPQNQDIHRSRSNGHCKSSLISQSLQWNQFDSILHGQHVQNHIKTEHPLPDNGIKVQPQITDRDIQNDANQLDSETQKFMGGLASPLEQQQKGAHGKSSSVLIKNSKIQYLKTPMQDIQNNPVVHLEVQGDQPLYEPNLRNICRENGWHLVKYDFQHNCITNSGTGQSAVTVRNSQPSDRQSLENLKQDLDNIGIKTKEIQQKANHRDMTSQLWIQQEQQRKELQELENYYQIQAKTFITSRVKTQKKSESKMRNSSFMKKSKYSHVY